MDRYWRCVYITCCAGLFVWMQGGTYSFVNTVLADGEILQKHGYNVSVSYYIAVHCTLFYEL